MTPAEGLYLRDDSWLYRLDPRVKLWIALLGIGFCVGISKLGWLIGVVIAAQILMLIGGIPGRKLIELWRALLPMLALILILQPLVRPGPGPDLWAWGPLRLTEWGLAAGVRYVLRVAGAAFMAIIPILTTPLTLLVRGIHRVGIPYTWALTIGLALRYLGTLVELYTVIGQAQQARGWDVSQAGIVRRVQAAGPTLIAVIIASLRLSDSLAVGLAARGFGLNRQRTALHEIQMQRMDWVVMGISGAMFGTMIVLATL